jgi:hypothetical protein
MNTDNVEKPKRRKGVRKLESLFMTKSELAFELGNADPKTIDKWVEEGSIPPPHDTPGQRTAIWLRRYFNAYVETGRWPDEAFRKRGDRPPGPA